MACVAEEGSKEDPEAILSDIVWHDSLSPFPVQQLMERNSSENGGGSMEEPKKREHSWSVMNWIQRGWSTEGDLAFKRERRKSTREITEVRVGINETGKTRVK